MPSTFRGGIHPEGYKNARHSQIRRMPAGARLTIPLLQGEGAEALPTVTVGQSVTMGQVIADVPRGALGCPVHASVSGVVSGLTEYIDPLGRKTAAIEIDNDGKYTPCPDNEPYTASLAEASPESIAELIRCAGIVGMGGAGYPTYAKTLDARGKASLLIINCAESEPFLSSDHRLLVENPASVINGAKILLRATGIKKAFIAIEDNKLDAANKLEVLLADDSMISVRVLRAKYPQGDERRLVGVLTGREIPSGGNPADVGCVVYNAQTCAAVYNAFAHGTPVTSRIVTVDGDCISSPRNVLVPIGTHIGELIAFCGKLRRDAKKIILGGPMTGTAVGNTDFPVTKTVTGVTVLSEKLCPEIPEHAACIRCGRCVAACPEHLMPLYLARSAKAGDLRGCEKYRISACTECGSCTYICPGGVQIVSLIHGAKEKMKSDSREKSISDNKDNENTEAQSNGQ